MLTHIDPADLDAYLDRLTDEWDMREKITGITSQCCGRECCRGGISGALFCPGCGNPIGPKGEVKP